MSVAQQLNYGLDDIQDAITNNEIELKPNFSNWVEKAIEAFDANGEPNYVDEILSGEHDQDILLPGEQPEGSEGEEVDALYDEAVNFVTEKRRVSISSVQRQFRIGYNRSARIVEQMEMQGVVSTPGNNGAREVLAPPPVRDF